MEDIQHRHPDPDCQVAAFLIREEDKTLGPGLYSSEIRSEFQFAEQACIKKLPPVIKSLLLTRFETQLNCGKYEIVGLV